MATSTSMIQRLWDLRAPAHREVGKDQFGAVLDDAILTPTLTSHLKKAAKKKSLIGIFYVPGNDRHTLCACAERIASAGPGHPLYDAFDGRVLFLANPNNDREWYEKMKFHTTGKKGAESPLCLNCAKPINFHERFLPLSRLYKECPRTSEMFSTNTVVAVPAPVGGGAGGTKRKRSDDAVQPVVPPPPPTPEEMERFARVRHIMRIPTSSAGNNVVHVTAVQVGDDVGFNILLGLTAFHHFRLVETAFEDTECRVLAGFISTVPTSVVNTIYQALTLRLGGPKHSLLKCHLSLVAHREVDGEDDPPPWTTELKPMSECYIMIYSKGEIFIKLEVKDGNKYVPVIRMWGRRTIEVGNAHIRTTGFILLQLHMFHGFVDIHTQPGCRLFGAMWCNSLDLVKAEAPAYAERFYTRSLRQQTEIMERVLERERQIPAKLEAIKTHQLRLSQQAVLPPVLDLLPIQQSLVPSTSSSSSDLEKVKKRLRMGTLLSDREHGLRVSIKGDEVHFFALAEIEIVQRVSPKTHQALLIVEDQAIQVRLVRCTTSECEFQLSVLSYWPRASDAQESYRTLLKEYVDSGRCDSQLAHQLLILGTQIWGRTRYAFSLQHDFIEEQEHLPPLGGATTTAATTTTTLVGKQAPDALPDEMDTWFGVQERTPKVSRRGSTRSDVSVALHQQ